VGAALLGGESQGLTTLGDHLAHLAHALGTLGLTALVAEDVGRPTSAGLDGRTNLALANTVAVTDVHDAMPQ